MPDVFVWISSLRSELEVVKGRRAELREQLEAVDLEHDRLETTVAVLEARLGADSGSGSPHLVDDVPLADRIVDALGTSGLSRQDLLRLFTAQGYTESAIDSAANRLRKRGLVAKPGRRFVRVLPSPGSAEPVASGPGPAEPVTPGLRGVGGPEPGVEPGPVAAASAPDRPAADGASDSGSADSSDGPEADADRRPLTEQVREAIAGGISTRKDLDEYFARRGVTARRVKRAVWSLRERKVKVLAPLPSGRLALADTDG